MSDEQPTPPWTEAPGSVTAGPDASDAPDGPNGLDPQTNRIRAADGLLVLSDFDGTLADIRPRPDQARIRPESKTALASLADLPETAVAVVSGRALSDVRERVGVEGIGYAGNHGLEIETPGRRFVHPEAEGATSTVDAVCEDLRRRLGAVEGAIVEEKGLTATVHYRQVPSGEVERVRRAVRATVDEHAGGARSGDGNRQNGERSDQGTLRVEEGKQVIELRPAVDWDKGRAVEWLRDVIVPDGASWHPLYVGDDVTDEDAFRALAGAGTTVRVGDPGGSTAADYLVDGPGAVASLLSWLGAVRQRDDEFPS